MMAGARAVVRLAREWPSHRTSVEQSETLYREPQRTCRRIFRFLGLDPVEIDPGTAHNPSPPAPARTAAGLELSAYSLGSRGSKRCLSVAFM